MESVQTRRHFIGNVATGLAGGLATGRALGANNRIRLGVIGMGERGVQLTREATACPNTEFVAAADVYARRLDEAKSLVAKTGEAGVTGYSDYRTLLEDKSIDAVLIATPQHLHAECFVAAMDAGKHVYQEKAMAFTVDHAKLMRAARQRSPRSVVQVGHQACSSGQIVTPPVTRERRVGQITAIHAGCTEIPRGQTAVDTPPLSRYDARERGVEDFPWQRPARDFDADRCQLASLLGLLGRQRAREHEPSVRVLEQGDGPEIPAAATMTGGVYLWKDGREVPDTMTVALELPEEILFTWDSGFGNNYPGVTEDVLGTQALLRAASRFAMCRSA